MDELIKNLREHAEWAEANQWEAPITLLDDLRQAADELEKRRWVSVEERLPEPGKKVFAFWQRGIETYVDFAYYMDGSMGEQWRYQNWVVPPDIITHWMVFPEPPKEDKP